jgi:hypothetical protein
MHSAVDKERLARKDYTCSCCRRTIKKGEKYTMCRFKGKTDYLCTREDCGEMKR